MSQRNVLKFGTAAAMVLFAASSFAAPTVLDFTRPNALVKSIEEDGFSISGGCTLLKCFGIANGIAYTNFADRTTTVSKTDGKLFKFLGIALDDYNNNTGLLSSVFSDYTIDFTFKHAKGADTKQTVTLNRTNGLEYFKFSESNLISASWTSSKWVRFDNIQTSAVPEPTTLALLPLALGGAFLASRRRKTAAK